MVRILKWVGISLGVFAAIGITLTLAGAWILGVAIDLTCADPPSETCQVRMRALGHLWAVEGNLPRAMTWYERAARAGDPVSMFHLGWVYQEVAEAGLIDAAKFIQSHGPGVIIDPDKPAQAGMAGLDEAAANAVTWFRKSAELGFAPAMNNLGEMYRLGVGVPADPSEAFRWHLRAARFGNPVGAINVAIDYRGGLGTPVDRAAAARWEDIDFAKTSLADLAEPTFERTLVFGVRIPERKRAEMRAAAEQSSHVQLTQRPLAPDPRIPTFKQTVEKERQREECAMLRQAKTPKPLPDYCNANGG